MSNGLDPNQNRSVSPVMDPNCCFHMFRNFFFFGGGGGVRGGGREKKQQTTRKAQSMQNLTKHTELETCLNMTEKLLTGTKRTKPNKQTSQLTIFQSCPDVVLSFLVEPVLSRPPPEKYSLHVQVYYF